MLYRSTDRTGRPTPVSGIVLVPVGLPAPAGGRHVVAWAHGTTGLIDGCAPSLDNQAGGRLNSPESYDRIDRILAAGHVVTASDYPGLGTPGVHPYLDGVGEGRAVLDSIRVARAFGASEVAVVQGFSQGSQAAIFAGQEWSTYAPEIDLRAVVAIGTPARFGQAFAALDLPVVQSYIGKVLAGIVAGHPELDRTQILTPSGEEAYDRFAALDTPDGFCDSPAFDPPNDLAADPTTVPAWRAAFEANEPGRELVPVPVLMVQSEADEQALAFLADGVCLDLVANGADVRMWRYDDESHVASVGVSADDRMAWILDRLAGDPLTDAVAFTGEQPEVLTTCPGSPEPEPGPHPCRPRSRPSRHRRPGPPHRWPDDRATPADRPSGEREDAGAQRAQGGDHRELSDLQAVAGQLHLERLGAGVAPERTEVETHEHRSRLVALLAIRSGHAGDRHAHLGAQHASGLRRPWPRPPPPTPPAPRARRAPRTSRRTRRPRSTRGTRRTRRARRRSGSPSSRP